MEKQALETTAGTHEAKRVLIAGASFAGLSTAFWMNQLGFAVTVVEVAPNLKKGGTPVDIEGSTVATIKRMGIFDKVQANRLKMLGLEFKNADDVTEGGMSRQTDDSAASDDCEIERDVLLEIMFDAVKDSVEFRFGNGIASIQETPSEVTVSFKDGTRGSFDLLFGCDGNHSSVRRMHFGPEADYANFLGQYFSITIVEGSLIKENTTQMFNVPGKAAMLNAYNNKTDIVLCFSSEEEIAYDYRDEAHQRLIIAEQFQGMGWRVPELLEKVESSKTFYFDKISQIKMPSWTKGRVGLVGDAAYCASPAAGMGGSLAIIGAAALRDAFANNDGQFEAAFHEYNEAFRPYLEDVQARAANNLDMLVPMTEEAIRVRNASPNPW